ncbi:MAG: cytochrome c [Candidatus Tectomicrobia bacterium]|uniref:Cytochrome c n=1 Tax=Tectimicrobiota bacterium TaxID=2528274 RepID=A0A933GKX2_UNCTE|nr:cytochrome c [Candidatus Tectomicrobia bacterium]
MVKNLLFAFLGTGIIISFILLFWRESDREWIRYQRAFQNMEREKIQGELQDSGSEEEGMHLESSSSAVGKSAIEIKQIFLKDLAVIDRCPTCHLGIADQRWAEAPQPFTSHTEPTLSFHPVERFGCTVCHQGQGLATTIQGAHGYDSNWKDPLLPLNYIEASCNQCHSNLTFREARRLARGKYLIVRLGCPGCHEAKGFQKLVSNLSPFPLGEGGSGPGPGGAEKIGGTLDQIKYKVAPDWIRRFIKDPVAYSKETRMPNFQFKDQEIEQITAFLLSLGEKNQDESQFTEKAAETDLSGFSSEELEKGKKLVSDFACITCHNIKGMKESGFFKPDKISPELSKVGSKLKLEWLQGYLKDPGKYQPDSRKPAYRFDEEEIRYLTLVLASLKDDEAVTNGGQEGTKAESKDFGNEDKVKVGAGKGLIIKYNCVGCHDIKGIGKSERGPAWDGIASRPIRKFDFGDNPDKIEISRTAWIKAKIMKPRSWRSSLKMPQLNVSEEDAVALTTALLSLTNRKIPQNYLVEDKETANLHVQIPSNGPVGNLWKKFKCLQCHPIAGKGADIGPDLAFEGSRVKPEWLNKYLEKPVQIRPVLAVRMPNLRINAQEAKLLSDYIVMALVDNKLPVGFIREDNISEQSLTLARKIFTLKDSCIGCHKVENKGGKVGPDLAKLGNRLNGDWIYAYLKNPQLNIRRIRRAMMPKYDFTEEEARALTGYLLNLRSDDL